MLRFVSIMRGELSVLRASVKMMLKSFADKLANFLEVYTTMPCQSYTYPQVTTTCTFTSPQHNAQRVSRLLSLKKVCNIVSLMMSAQSKTALSFVLQFLQMRTD